MKYLKKFETHSDYTDYIQSLDFITPNVSYCALENEVHYTPHIAETRLVAKFNVTSISEPTPIMDTGGSLPSDLFTEIEVDGVVMSTMTTNVTFSTTGIHTVKYTLKDVTKLGDYMFNGCTDLVEVQIPYSVTDIGTENGAVFNGCTGLTYINIPALVETFNVPDNTEDGGMFEGCISLEEIHFDTRILTNIPFAFAKGCTSLSTITIPSSVTSIGESAFEGCTALTTITIPNSVTSIGASAFAGCTALTTITIPSSVTRIDNNAFNGTRLTSVYCYATTAPVLEKDKKPGDEIPQKYLQSTHVFGSSSDSSVDYPLYVPSESINSYKSTVTTQDSYQYADTWGYYDTRIQPIP